MPPDQRHNISSLLVPQFIIHCKKIPHTCGRPGSWQLRQSIGRGQVRGQAVTDGPALKTVFLAVISHLAGGMFGNVEYILINALRGAWGHPFKLYSTFPNMTPVIAKNGVNNPVFSAGRRTVTPTDAHLRPQLTFQHQAAGRPQTNQERKLGEQRRFLHRYSDAGSGEQRAGGVIGDHLKTRKSRRCGSIEQKYNKFERLGIQRQYNPTNDTFFKIPR